MYNFGIVFKGALTLWKSRANSDGPQTPDTMELLSLPD
jgi:hypothetical protein